MLQWPRALQNLNMLVKHSLPGLYVMPSASSALLWFGVLFLRKGIYQGGVFRFNLHIPENFPDCSCPRVIFESQIFHPSINASTNEMQVSHAFPEWRKDVNRLWHLLEHVYRSFYSIDIKDPANPEAAHLYVSDMEMFVERVKESVELSQARLYDPPPSDDPYYLKFDRFDEKIHGSAKEMITLKKVEENSSVNTGLSWVQFGSLEPFSKPIT
ncbi:AKT-interacting protein-like isoform X2 [Lycorma delicatula]|uniref:AKT-interacting protein-like isoform X2 n=1 Tax=Lycorma delicatula TaxID=130591 RepID=UPI003F511250